MLPTELGHDLGVGVGSTSTSKSGRYHLHTARGDPTSASFATLPLPRPFWERAKMLEDRLLVISAERLTFATYPDGKVLVNLDCPSEKLGFPPDIHLALEFTSAEARPLQKHYCVRPTRLRHQSPWFHPFWWRRHRTARPAGCPKYPAARNGFLKNRHDWFLGMPA